MDEQSSRNEHPCYYQHQQIKHTNEFVFLYRGGMNANNQPPSPQEMETQMKRWQDWFGKLGQLKDWGISFDHYDMPDMKLEGDLHVADGMNAAWFKDPDGNILGLVSG